MKVQRNGWDIYAWQQQNVGIKEIDRQLKEQCIHRLNDKDVLDKITRELTSKNSSQQMTSEDVLAWAKRVEVQRAQASILNDITKTKTFDKVKKEPELKNTGGREANIATHQRWPCRFCGGSHTPNIEYEALGILHGLEKFHHYCFG